MNKKQSIYEYIIYGISFAILVYRLYLLCIYGMPSFDGAMNLQVPMQLINTGKYMTTYDGGVMFDERIQTRLPVLLPIYILWKIFGIGSETALLVNAVYIILLITAIWKILGTLNCNRILRFACIIAILFMPYFSEYSMGIYGEIPTAFFILYSIYLLMLSEQNENKTKYFILSGLMYSLAILCKTVALIAIPSFAFVMIVKILKKQTKLKEIMKWVLAVLIPIVAFEIYKIIQLGINEYINVWSSELVGILMQAGVKSGYSDTTNIFEKISKHITLFCGYYKFKSNILVIVLLAIVFVSWIKFYWKDKKIGYYNIIFLVMFSYFGWWIAITPTQKAWARRIIIGVILLYVIMTYLFHLLLERMNCYKQIYQIIFISLLCIVYVYQSMVSIKLVDRTTKDEIVSLAQTIKDIDEKEDAIFYGSGWWQAPVLSFYSGVNFMNMVNGVDVEKGYFVIDRYAALLSPLKDNINRSYDLELIANVGLNELYKIRPIDYSNHNVASAWEKDIDESKIKSEWISTDNYYEYKKGIYNYEQGIKACWASTDVDIIMKRNERNNYLNIDLWRSDNINNDVQNIYLYINQEFVGKYELTSGGQQIEVDMRNYEDTIYEIKIMSDANVVVSNDARNLSYRINKIYFD